MSEPTLTTVSQLTPLGRGAVATIGIAGDLSLLDGCFGAANGRRAAAQLLDRIVFGRWGADPPEEVVFVRTGDRTAEVHAHGGFAAAGRILADLRRLGAVVVAPHRLWDEAPVIRECRDALERATTRKAAHHVLRQCSLFPAALGSLAAALSSSAVGPEGSIESPLAQIEGLLRDGEFGVRLTAGWQVVLCGRPNVGKSSLMNALAGFTRSIVIDQPGSTRDVVQMETAFDGWPVVLSDTAGLRRASGEIEAAGIARTRSQLASADVVLLVLDAVAGWTEEDRELVAALPGALRMWNKCDLAPPPDEALAVSATTGLGLEKLHRQLAARLAPTEPAAGTAFPVSPGQLTRLRAIRDDLADGSVAAARSKLGCWLGAG